MILLKDVQGIRERKGTLKDLKVLFYYGVGPPPRQNINIPRGELVNAKQDDPSNNYQLWSDPNIIIISSHGR